MYYISTRGTGKVTASQAIVNGLAPDGGLYVPCEFPQLQDFIGMSYNEIAFHVLRLYLTDFSDDEITGYIKSAYDPNPVRINGDYLELFHGRTSAFKDVALQLFPYLLTASLRKNGVTKETVILTATSGDTGSAVLSSIAGRDNIRSIVFYPDGGTSNIQKLQMTTQEGDNVNVFGIKGNFDDAQTAVKEMFADNAFRAEFEDRYHFTSANSINLGRLLPQIVYYFYSYSEAIKTGPINYVVPTGNFGNILAGYYAKKMGLPIDKLICASNENNVLDDFFKTGVYDSNRDFKTTLSPSMDILVSSNLERFTYEKVSPTMFESDYATDVETIQTIKDVYNETKYILDPHTAVAKCVYDKYMRRAGDDTRAMILATASPYKFPETVEGAIGKVLTNPPENLQLEHKPVLHDKVVDDMRGAVRGVLKS